MATIREDFVSFETAKLLKEKGFKEITQGYITADKEIYMLNFQEGVYELGKNKYPYPTLQMAMKWLREEHNIHIWIGHAAGKVLPWYYEIHGMSDGKVKHIGGIQCGSYEVACEAAIKYCLKNLI